MYNDGNHVAIFATTVGISTRRVQVMATRSTYKSTERKGHIVSRMSGQSSQFKRAKELDLNRIQYAFPSQSKFNIHPIECRGDEPSTPSALEATEYPTIWVECLRIDARSLYSTC